MKEQYGSEKGEQVYYAMENKRKNYAEGSMMVPPEMEELRKQYGITEGTKIYRMLNEEARAGDRFVDGEPVSSTEPLPADWTEVTDSDPYDLAGPSGAALIKGLERLQEEKGNRPLKKDISNFFKVFSPDAPKQFERYIQDLHKRRQFEKESKTLGRDVPEMIKTLKAARNEILRNKTKKYGGGKMKKYNEGSMAMPPEMEDMEAEPVDTYPNIPPEEMDEAMASQLPDEEMMQEYIDFVVDESLEDEEKDYLMNALSQDEQLSQIFDKVVETASEFSGSGMVDGPGSGVSDSIPARLSAGEFVITKKATDQIGAENLQQMMDEAERAYDGGLMTRPTDPATGVPTDEEIRKQMLNANQMPSVR